MTSTRPNLAYTKSTLSKFTAAPTQKHLTTAKQVLRYFSPTKNLGLTCTSNSGNDQPVRYRDTDWARDCNDQKSIDGNVFTLQGAAISWKARKQTIVALSSREAKYINCSEATREAIGPQRLYQDLSQASAIVKLLLLYAVNQGANSLAENTRFHESTKHIDLKYHPLRDSIEKGLIRLNTCSTGI